MLSDHGWGLRSENCGKNSYILKLKFVTSMATMPGVKVKSLLSISNDLDCRKFHSKTLICHKGSAGTMPGGENIKEMWHSKY